MAELGWRISSCQGLCERNEDTEKKCIYGLTAIKTLIPKQRRHTTILFTPRKRLQRTSAVIKHKTTMGTVRIQNQTTADIDCNKKYNTNTNIELINEYGEHTTSLFIHLLRCYMLRPQCVATGKQTP